MKQEHLILLTLFFAFSNVVKAQPGDCKLKTAQNVIHFGSGAIEDLNISDLPNYVRVGSTCPTDGHYSFVPYTIGCFRDDWHTLNEDHTPGDNDGNMLLVNAAPRGGRFLSMPVMGLKANTTYQLGLWLLNLCKPTKKCPMLLLPNLNIRLETTDGKVIAIIVTKDLSRVPDPKWTQHIAYFKTPDASAELLLVMTDNAPGGCGNDFALDDITFRECVTQSPKAVTASSKNPPPKPAASPKPLPAKSTTTKPPVKQVTASKPPIRKPSKPQSKRTAVTPGISINKDSASSKVAVISPAPTLLAPAPMVLKTRRNELARKIETEAGEIRIKIYDNGEIDGDTVSIYHNNILIRSHQRLSQQPITITIDLDKSQPHHELVMVAENLGSIPPNTSVMTITTSTNSYEVFISSTRQKNAKVIFDLKH
ncbi:MAG TPA: hypothetical protein VLC28_14430 [Flavitalea sp.]|nr:hypothetical protein [Flavitalea sp.]